MKFLLQVLAVCVVLAGIEVYAAWARDTNLDGNLVMSGQLLIDPVSTQEQGFIDLKEDEVSGTAYHRIQAPDDIITSRTCTLGDGSHVSGAFIPDECVGDGLDATGAETLTAGVGLTRATDDFYLNTENRTLVENFAVISPDSTKTGLVQAEFGADITITNITWSTDFDLGEGNGIDINFENRARTTPNTAGTDISSADITCDYTSEATAGLSAAKAVDTDSLVVLMLADPTGTANVVRAHITYTVDNVTPD